ncbi:EboA domain-containing protein [Mangrovihabitans endophyticus]|uniref:Sugar phosphate isomerase n=1 Tax=Mangrovihabitans endophyticus TaxID=1751298 RepID=A0A8J3BS63_9ACTN|nr:EboA domain-containing protein [Mangrovihabitans endophyticus]GGK73252.1 hypothetical protein GCM10012284_03910 [Mangrovihabitans endophyticus]
MNPAAAPPSGPHWLAEAQAGVLRDPDTAGTLIAAAARELPPAGVTRGRAVLLAAVLRADAGVARLATLYRHGDSGEKLDLLRALPLLPDPGGLPAAAIPLLRDALRSNDDRLVAAALGPYSDHLDQAAWRHGVLKCVFLGVPLARVHRLGERADAELAVMIGGLAAERDAAGRRLPPDAAALLRHLTAATTDDQPVTPAEG